MFKIMNFGLKIYVFSKNSENSDFSEKLGYLNS